MDVRLEAERQNFSHEGDHRRKPHAKNRGAEWKKEHGTLITITEFCLSWPAHFWNVCYVILLLIKHQRLYTDYQII